MAAPPTLGLAASRATSPRAIPARLIWGRPKRAAPSAPGQTRSVPDATRALGVLRIGFGIIWALNLLYILNPENQFFPSFAATAASYGASSIGGSALAAFVAQNPLPFATAIAGVTAYLAIAFVLGATTRVACVVGFGFNTVLLLTQFGTIWIAPGGTDIGPQPLYLLVYSALFVGRAGGLFGLDGWWARSSRGWALGRPTTVAPRSRSALR
jgi:hypothetical protein